MTHHTNGETRDGVRDPLRARPTTNPGPRPLPIGVTCRPERTSEANAGRKVLVFVAGYRRSGTTALQDQLASHPDVHYFSGITRNEFHLFDLIDRDRDEYAALVEAHTGRAPRFDATADAEAVFAGCPTPIGLVKSTRLLLGASGWRRFADWARWTDHQVVLLSIVRYPLDAISSDIRRDSPELPVERRTQPIIPDARVARPQTAQEVWCEAYRRATAEAESATRSTLVRLEDIVADPVASCAALGDWIGLRSPLIVGEWKALHWGRWRDDPAFRGFQPSADLIELAGRLGYHVEASGAGRRAG